LELPMPEVSKNEAVVQTPLTGRIKWFDENKSYGFILTDDGKEVFVHRKFVKGFKKYSLLEGDEVSFETFQSDEGVQAKNVVKVKDDPDEMMNRRRAERYLKNIMRKNDRVTFRMSLRRTFVGTIKEVRIYDYLVQTEQIDPLEVKKLEVKCLYKFKNAGPITRTVQVDEAIKKKKLMPAEKIKDRYFIPNILLEELVKNKKKVTVTISDGESMSGPIDWYTKFEFLLSLSPRLKVLVFRHAIVDFKVQF
jgi:CspA family cold shock protein